MSRKRGRDASAGDRSRTTSGPASRPGEPAAAKPQRGPVGYYYPTVFLTGAGVMVIELLGARVLAPYYGTSLFVWSSLITITLVALAVGYWLGGQIADRLPRPQILYTIIALAGLATALVAPLRGPVLRGTDALGVRAGSLTSAFVLFTVPLLLLGMVSPYAVKLSTLTLGKLARTAGRLYAVSTFGSFAGTLSAGFILIPTFEVRTILVVVSGVLVAVSLVFFAFSRRVWMTAVVAALLAVVIMLVPGSRGITAAGDTRLVAKQPSFYGEIKVVERGPLRFMLIDGGVQSGIDTRNGLCAVQYPYMIETLAYRIRPEGERALVIGLGAGIIPEAMDRWGVESDVIEIDPKVVAMAEEHFGFDPGEYGVRVADGRRFLEDTEERYDYVVLDAFAGEMVPVHLLSEEAFEAARDVLRPGGLLLLNYVGYRSGPGSRVAASIELSLEAAFEHVRAFEAGEPGDYGGNIFVASESPLEMAVGPDEPLPFPVHEVLSGTATRVRPSDPSHEGAIVFTDEHNPVDLWDIEGRERWRRDTMEFFPGWVLLG
ncbi:MAG: methyltransferase domain-containing protein [Candidatus Eisenbacteria bacterium]|nr:methyltransferase domain-containing protein [Candidatus Eisenbacteria bacterium]